MFTLKTQTKAGQDFVTVETLTLPILDSNVDSYIAQNKTDGFYTTVYCPAGIPIPAGWAQSYTTNGECDDNGKLIKHYTTLPSGDRPIYRLKSEVITDTSALLRRRPVVNP